MYVCESWYGCECVGVHLDVCAHASLHVCTFVCMYENVFTFRRNKFTFVRSISSLSTGHDNSVFLKQKQYFLCYKVTVEVYIYINRIRMFVCLSVGYTLLIKPNSIHMLYMGRSGMYRGRFLSKY